MAPLFTLTDKVLFPYRLDILQNTYDRLTYYKVQVLKDIYWSNIWVIIPSLIVLFRWVTNTEPWVYLF